MKTTRIVYLGLVLAIWGTNGAALFWGEIAPGALIMNMVLAPLAIWAAYRSGQASQEEFRKSAAVRAAAVNAKPPKAR